MSATATAATRRRGLTHRDLDDAPDDGNRWEVIDGELHVSPIPTPRHQHAITQLATELNTFVRERGLGAVFVSGLKVVLDEPTGVGPDLVFISTARMDGLRDDGYYGAPDLIVEVLSSKPGLDRHIKHARYERAGVAAYWIVDPGKRTLEAWRLEGGRYVLRAEVAGDAVFEPEGFEGLRVRLAELWM